MTQGNDSSNKSVVYLLKSTYYPHLRQKILSLLSLPNDLVQIVEYDSRWIAEEIERNPKNFEGMNACVIFLDYSSDLLEFWPLRLCKIARIIPPGNGVTYQIFLKVGSYVKTRNGNFSSEIRNYLQGKQLIKNENGKNSPNKLVFLGDNSILKMLEEGAWEDVVDHLVGVQDIQKLKIEQFKNSVFYKLDVLEREELSSPLRPKDGIYELDPGKYYSLSFAVYHPHYSNFKDSDIKENVIDFPEELLHHVGPKTCSLPAHQRKYTKYFDFWTKDLMTGGKSMIVVRLKKEEFIGPYVQIPFIIRRKRLQLWLLLLVLMVGLILLGMSDVIAFTINSYVFKAISKEAFQLLICVLGTVMSMLPIAWLELKRLAR